MTNVGKPAEFNLAIDCRYCSNKYTGLPENACENCMNTGQEAIVWPLEVTVPAPMRAVGTYRDLQQQKP